MCNNDNVVLLGTFLCHKKKVKLIFHNEALIWNNEKSPSEPHNLPIKNVLSVKHYFFKTPLSVQKVIDINQFTIHYAEKLKNNKWIYKNITFKHSDAALVSTWIKTLQNYLSYHFKRPKQLLLFINPFGGKQNAMEIYEKYGKKLFTLAEIDVTVNVSQRKNQIRDFILNHDIEMFDSVACVGGDGTVSELLNGLVLRECKLKNIDPNDINATLPKSNMSVGIIPAGSTDTIAYCIHGTTDRTTAVLQIIFGDTLGLDLVSVYDEHNLLRLYASTLSYGYLGDVVYHSDQYRWMGPRRYDYSGFKKIILNKGYEGELAIFTDNKAIDPVICEANCEICTNATADQIETCRWETLRGKFFMVSGANISCACSRSPKGLAPHCHLGDGKVHIVLVKHTSVINNLKLFLKLSNSNAIEDLPFVETYSAREFCFRTFNTNTSKWNCDGEIQHQTNIRAKARCQLLNIFSRGADKQVTKPRNCCGL